MYEKNSGVGGTWFENRYPGCACDVPSHNYVYSFEPKADFSSVYASSAEICGYFEMFVKKYGLHKHIKESHVVENTRWIESDGTWEVKIKNLLTGESFYDSCNILVHACGYLNKPAWPNVPGLKDYKGVKLHTADYDESVSLEGKEVILIGAGSSAVQTLPAIQSIVKRVKIFIRSPVWVLPDIGTEAATFKSEELQKFKDEPHSLMEMRQNNERTMNSIFSKYFWNMNFTATTDAL